MNRLKKRQSLLVVAFVCTTHSVVYAADIDWELYASIRLAAEAVDPDLSKSYTGLRDAYTRFGIKANFAINDAWSVSGQLEAPFDLANMQLQSPSDQTEDYRIARLQLSGPIGTVWYGRGWLAFYNYITAPVDYFSSYYSGWQTYTSFRKSETFYYSSPQFAGFKFDFSNSGEDNNNRKQYVISYNNGGLNLALGRDDLNNATDVVIDGAAVSYSTGPWYAGAKYEIIDSNPASGFYTDGREVFALLGQYQLNEKNTLRAYAADADGVGDSVFHLGWDHQYTDKMKVFAEYYNEETAAAISSDKNPEKWVATGGGSVATLGIRYDFSSK